MTDTKHCPFCDELIRIKASKCRYCLSVLTGGDQSASEKDPKKQINLVALAWIITLGVLVFAAVFIFIQQRQISKMKSARPQSAILEAMDFQPYTETAFGLNMEMVRVTGGTFTMGCNPEHKIDCFSDEKLLHQVHLSNYLIGRTPVTQRQWKLVMGSNPSRFQDCPECPVENVSWRDAMDFIRKLNRETGKTYSLPTEAQWEFAARGGQDGGNSKYSGHNYINQAGWFRNNSERKTHPVGGKLSNNLGLYDMSGNVWEWCSDWYGRYKSDDTINPTGPSSGSYRVVRGGSWSNIERYCRVSARQKEKPNRRIGNIGFRLLLDNG